MKKKKNEEGVLKRRVVSKSK